LKPELVIIPDVANGEEFEEWLPNVEGKFVMISMHQPTGRPDYNWEELATEESFEKMKEERDEQTACLARAHCNTGHNARSPCQSP
jgi:carboxypeptidase Q